MALVAGAAFVGTTLVGTGPRDAAPAVGPPQGVLADERPPVYLSVGGRLSSAQRAELSSAGQVAWISLENELVVHDLDSQEDLFRTPVPESTALVAVGDRALVSEGRSLKLLGARRSSSWPGTGSPAPRGSAVTRWRCPTALKGGRASTTSPRGRQSCWTSSPGGGLSPDGTAYLAAPGEEQDGQPVLWTRAGEARSVTGLAGTVTGVTWVDDETA